jgi:hypothetical protein
MLYKQVPRHWIVLFLTRTSFQLLAGAFQLICCYIYMLHEYSRLDDHLINHEQNISNLQIFCRSSSQRHIGSAHGLSFNNHHRGTVL